jgi:hypothetical protein
MRKQLIDALIKFLVPTFADAIQSSVVSLGMLRWLGTPEGRVALAEHLNRLERTWIDLQRQKKREPLTPAQADAAWNALKDVLIELDIPSNGPELHPSTVNRDDGLKRHMIDYWTGASRKSGYVLDGREIHRIFPCLPPDATAFTGHYVGVSRRGGNREGLLAIMAITQLRIEEALEELAKREKDGG